MGDENFLNLIRKIVELEWQMFINLQVKDNMDHSMDQAEEDIEKFQVSRASQFMSWSEAALESCLNDLSDALQNNRNLFFEKYARMMQSTSPVEYRLIEHLLPALSPEIDDLIEKIIEIELSWQEEIEEKYSQLIEQRRPLYSLEDSHSVVSTETYLRSELSTYSEETLRLHYQHRLDQKSRNINGAEITFYCFYSG